MTLKPIGAWSQLATGSSLASVQTNLTPPETAATRARLLFGCFRKGEANDPETYTLAVAATLALYPLDVVMAVTDPLVGLAARTDFLPTLRELRTACDELVGRAAREKERAARIERQLAEREEYERHRQNAPTRAELEAMLGRPLERRRGHRWAPLGPDAAEIAVRLKAEHGLSNEQWNALPDAPARETESAQ